MRKIKLPTDRTVFSTDNNGYAGNERDETLVDQNLWTPKSLRTTASPTESAKSAKTTSRLRRGGVHARTGGVTPPESRRRKPFPHHGVGRIATPGGALSGTSRTDADNPDPPDRGPGPAYPMRVFSTGDKIFHGKAR